MRPVLIRSRGFTLVELLVAISILAMVAVLGWRGLDGIVRARVALTDQMEVTRGMQLAFAQMQSDAEHMAEGALLDKRAYLQAGVDRLTLVRTSYIENEAMRLQVVSYRVQDGMLTRRESASTRDLMQLDVLWQAAISDVDPTPPVTLQAGVTGMQVDTWQQNQWQQGAQQQKDVQPQPPAPGEAGPGGLQVALQVQGLAAPMRKAFLLGGI
ncbi:type II secretory pathway component PulJ [Massilia eurypsychrophila]|uniref:Type II secretory pathway component PulJ n=1 Tax=Massilia eurypsychrophila TaxID=1485217 RepID=A0A2G8TM27_9BURK|nr:prepilin-type N-terminal cleavage/methylation domain-containing protein [Massilia eurypsychrophila]PIL47049.1 type II secretory pathway component PulJ [Massilia eurypsychrophila]